MSACKGSSWLAEAGNMSWSWNCVLGALPEYFSKFGYVCIQRGGLNALTDLVEIPLEPWKGCITRFSDQQANFHDESNENFVKNNCGR